MRWKRRKNRSGRAKNSSRSKLVISPKVNPITIKEMPMLTGKEIIKTFSWGKTRDIIPRVRVERIKRARIGATSRTLKTRE